MSDFKSNEYANLIAGKRYEPHEENPMLGFRGASRYISESFRPCFELECKALKYVREEMGLTNIKIMIPFVRTVDEARQVNEILAANGLKRGDRSEEHTSELQSLMRISYAGFCLKKNNKKYQNKYSKNQHMTI